MSVTQIVLGVLAFKSLHQQETLAPKKPFLNTRNIQKLFSTLKIQEGMEILKNMFLVIGVYSAREKDFSKKIKTFLFNSVLLIKVIQYLKYVNLINDTTDSWDC